MIEDDQATGKHSKRGIGVLLVAVVLSASLSALISVLATRNTMSARFAAQTRDAVAAQKAADEHKAEATLVGKVIDSLGKLNAGVDVGVNYTNYYNFLLDSKAAINTLRQADPSNVSLKLADKVQTNFEDAGQIWRILVNTPDLADPTHNKALDALFIAGPPLEAIWKKYGFKDSFDSKSQGVTSLLQARDAIWKQATDNYNALSKISNDIRLTSQSSGRIPAAAGTRR